MADANGFYITLPSNSSSDYYANTQARFKVKLPKALDLPGQWEVGLVEFSYTQSWDNVLENFLALYAYDVAKEAEKKPMHMQRGFWPSKRAFCRDVNNKLQKELGGAGKFPFGNATFMYNAISHNIDVKLAPNLRLLLSKKMADILGFDMTPENSKDGFRVIKNKDSSRWAPDIHQGLYTFFIYCDIIEPAIIGHALAPLLRTCQAITPKSDPEQVTVIFDRPHYHALNKQYFESIEIFIKDDAGTDIAFTKGKSLVKLHLRPRKPSYL